MNARPDRIVPAGSIALGVILLLMALRMNGPGLATLTGLVGLCGLGYGAWRFLQASKAPAEGQHPAGDATQAPAADGPVGRTVAAQTPGGVSTAVGASTAAGASTATGVSAAGDAGTGGSTPAA